MWNARYFCPIVTKFGVSRQIFVKVPNIKLHEISFSGNRADTRGEADRQEDGQTRRSQLTSFIINPKAPKNLNLRTIEPQLSNVYMSAYFVITCNLRFLLVLPCGLKHVKNSRRQKFFPELAVIMAAAASLRLFQSIRYSPLRLS